MMKRLFLNRAKIGFVAGCLTAALPAASGADIDELEGTGWYLRAGPVARFNVKATIHAVNPTLPARHYDDGFVLPDIGGSTEYTSNWGYENAAQVIGDNLVMHRYDSVPTFGEQEIDIDSPLLGGEMIGGYRFSGFRIFNRPAHLGVELGYGYSRISQDMRFINTGTSSYTTDSYALNGVVPPQAPYAGTDSAFGPLLSFNNNSSATVTSAASTDFRGTLETTLQNFRFGPAFEVDITEAVTLAAGFGYSSVHVDATINYSEIIAFANSAVPTINSSRTLNDSGWQPGVYFELRGNYQFSRYVGAYVGGDFQYNKSFEFGNDTRFAEIDLGSTFAAKGGVVVRF